MAIAAVLCLLGTLLSPAVAFAASGAIDAVRQKYTIAEFSTDHEQVTKDGTVMSFKLAGVYSLPVNQMLSTPPDNPVTDGKIKSPNMVVKYGLEKFHAHVLQSGEKVYITGIEDRSDAKTDVLKFNILTVDDLDVTGVNARKKFSASVSFHFKKGYLNETPPEELENAIEAVMAPDSGGDQAQAGPAAPAPAPAPPQPPLRPAVFAPPAPAPVAAPATITIGESSTQVLQAMGMPRQMIDLGRKKTFVYPNMKVIFVDDKVSDVR